MLLLGTRRNLQSLSHSSELAPGRVWLGRRLLGLVGDVEGSCAAALVERLEFRCYLTGLLRLEEVTACVEINQCVGCTRKFFTKSCLGDDTAVIAP